MLVVQPNCETFFAAYTYANAILVSPSVADPVSLQVNVVPDWLHAQPKSFVVLEFVAAMPACTVLESLSKVAWSPYMAATTIA